MADYGYTVPGTPAWTALVDNGAITALANNMSANAEFWMEDLPGLWEENCASIFAPTFDQGIFVNVSNRSLYEMFETDGRLCGDTLTCAYPYCTYLDDDRANPSVGEAETVAELGVLPALSAAPGTVSDIVKLVEFADANTIQISVKIAGHSFIGQSYVKDSLQINMRNLPKYADGESTDSITVCDGDTGVFVPSVPEAMDVCDLATARGRTGVIRSGGGVIWDELYRSVGAWNDANEVQFQALGGFSGTVGVNGGYWQGGGLAGGGGMREYGVSADQVLMIEMVLPNGEHVRFRPTAWEDDENMDVPQTTAVTGWCNQNPYADNEADWQWQDCSDDYNFEDLWFATRGGGGGTWGIVTNSWYGLFPPQASTVSMIMMPPFNEGFPGKPTQAYCDEQGEEKCTTLDLAIQDIWMPYWIDFMYFPENLDIEGLTTDIGYKCNVISSGLYVWAFGCFVCNGESAELFVSSWTTVVNRQREALMALDPDGGITNELIDSIAGSFEILATSSSYMNLFFDIAPLSVWGIYQPGVPEGRLRDAWNPAVVAPYHDNPWSAMIPMDYFMENQDEFMQILQDMATDIRSGTIPPPINVFGMGGLISRAHDGMTAVPYADNSFLMMSLPTVPYQERVLTAILGEGPHEGPYPGLNEFNHVGNREYGPLKSDWTTACNMEWSVPEKDEQCISLQEAVWGTERLSRLEAIKDTIDPKHLFNCFASVGYIDTNQPAPSASEDGGGMGDGSGGGDEMGEPAMTSASESDSEGDSEGDSEMAEESDGATEGDEEEEGGTEEGAEEGAETDAESGGWISFSSVGVLILTLLTALSV